VLLTGGRDARDVVISKTEVYDARKGRFARGPAMTTNLLVAGGYDDSIRVSRAAWVVTP
jgi:hypothetical protein